MKKLVRGARFRIVPLEERILLDATVAAAQPASGNVADRGR